MKEIVKYSCRIPVKNRDCGVRMCGGEGDCVGCSSLMVTKYKTVTFSRTYEYKCPGCSQTAAPVDYKNNEILSVKCNRKSRHESGTSETMTLVKLNAIKFFEFEVKI